MCKNHIEFDHFDNYDDLHSNNLLLLHSHNSDKTIAEHEYFLHGKGLYL